MSDFKKRKIYVIGAGKVGSSFVYEFIKKKYSLSFVTQRNFKKSKTFLNDLKKKKISCSEKIEFDYVKNSDVIFIMTQDIYISDVVMEIKSLKLDLKNKLFFQISGSLSSEVFKLLNIVKNNCGSFHPIQTFNKVTKNSSLVENIYFGIEGGSNAVNYLKKTAKDFNSNYIIVNPKKKYLYHAASVIASNYLTGLVFAVSKIIKEIGGDENKTYKIFEPIIKNTLSNIESQGIVKSLTGPIERNDIEIIEKHIKELKKMDAIIHDLYLNFGLITTELSYKKKSINRIERNKLEKLMKK